MEAQLVKHKKVARKKTKRSQRPVSPTPSENSVTSPPVALQPEAAVELQSRRTSILSLESTASENEPTIWVSELSALRSEWIEEPSAPVYPMWECGQVGIETDAESMNMVPSAPTAPSIDVAASAPSDVEYPAVPAFMKASKSRAVTEDRGLLLQMHQSLSLSTTHEVASASLYPATRSLVAVPSAPPALSTDMPFMSNALRHRVATEQKPLNMVLQVHPLPEQLLANFYANSILSEHTKVVEDFRSNASNLAAMDDFFERVREYESAFMDSQRARIRLQTLQVSVHNIAARIWTLRKQTESVEAACSDGVKLKHTFTSEVAVYNEQGTAELEGALVKIRDEFHKTLMGCQFKCKLAKLWIQNYLDDYLSQSPICSLPNHAPSSPAQSPRLSARVPFDSSVYEEDIARVKHFIDVLFHYEKKSNANARGMAEGGGGVQGEENLNSSVFLRDVRGWITQLISALLKVASPYDHRFILLHVLRCEGIGGWGASFVQWPVPAVWSEDYLHHYLTGLYALLGPVEELEEKRQTHEVEQQHFKQKLKKLEESDWVVVDEEDVGLEIVEESSTFILEDDYMVLLDQFNVAGMFQCVLQNQGALSTDEKYPTAYGGASDRQLLKLFAIANNLLSILARAFRVFPPKRFASLNRKVGETICACARLLADSLSADLNRWTYDAPNQSFHRPLVVNGQPHTTEQAEIDTFVYRAARYLFSAKSTQVWACMASLPVGSTTIPTRWVLLSGIVKGNVIPLEEATNDTLKELLTERQQRSSRLESMLLSGPASAQHVLAFLGRLVLAENGNISSRSSPMSSDLHQLTIAVARTVFDVCVLNGELRGSLAKEVNSLLGEVTQLYPYVTSCILDWTRENFAEAGEAAVTLFASLPLTYWCPSLQDLETVTSLLKDPVGSLKFRLGRLIIDGLDWETSPHNSAELKIPRSQHRYIALTLANICLDRQSLRDSRTGIISTTTSIASKGIATVGSYALPASLSHLYVDYEKEFFEWCWKTILKLNLYQRPTSHDTYTLDTLANGEKPFEALANPSLATLRGAMRSNAMAAYVVLMMSDVGHHYHIFQQDGWPLLQVIADDGRPEAVLRVATELFPTFGSTYGVESIYSNEFRRFFGNFFRNSFFISQARGVRSNATDQNSGNISQESKPTAYEPLEKYMRPLLMVSDPLSSVHDENVALNFWLHAVFADRDWPYNRTILRVLDMICEYSFIAGSHQMVLSALAEEYRLLIAAYKSNSESSLKLSLRKPLESVYSVASAVETLYLGFPTLVVGSDSTMVAGRSWVEKECLWFAFAGLLAETEAEAVLRRTVGQALSRDSQMSLAAAAGDVTKPIGSFTIYRWANQVLEIPLDHPILPLFLQIFFSLYFQRTPTPAIPANACFGFRFLVERKELVDRLSRRLGQCSQFYADLATRKTGGEISLADQLSQLTNAMGLWLHEPRLVISDVYVDSFNERFCVPRLKEVLSGRLLDTFSAAWFDLIPIHSMKAQLLFNTRKLSLAHSADGRIGPSSPTSPNGEPPSLIFTAHVLPAPIFTPRPPLVQSLGAFNVRTVTSIFDKDVATLVEKSRSFIAFVAEHVKVDEDYVLNLSKLYSSETKRGRAERTCGSKCKGQVVYDYRVQDVRLMGDVKTFLKENRAHAEALMGGDHMDPKVCIAALKVMRAID
ncbi:Ectopic P granules protein 5, partial [Borealophlyctis nickersoniae]